MINTAKGGLEMKELVTITLIIVMLALICAALASCNQNSNIADYQYSSEKTKTRDRGSVDKNDADSYLGLWKSDHMSFQFLDNGTGRYDWENIWEEFTYTVSDGVVTIISTESRTANEYAVLELNADGTVLSLIQNGLEYYARGETQFKKTNYNKK